jgi:hypothetical protein
LYAPSVSIGAVAQHDAAGEVVFGEGSERVHLRPGRAQFGVTEKGGRVGLERAAVKTWHSAVGQALVAEMFETEHDPRGHIGPECNRGVDAMPLHVAAAAVAAGVLGHGIDPERGRV